MKTISRPISNQRGQTLIEYIIIVALVAVSSIALMRSVGQQINVNFAKVVHALGGKVDKAPVAAEVKESAHSRKDMKSFFNHARDRGDKDDKSSDE